MCVMHAAARVHRMPTTCHHASFIDTLPMTNQRGLRSVGRLRLVIVQWQKVARKRWHPKVQWQQVATGGIQMSSSNKWQQVSPGGSAIAFQFAPRAPN